MNIKTRTIVLSVMIITSICSCENKVNCPPCFTPPQELYLKITDSSSGSDLIFNNTVSQDSIEFFYFENERKFILEHDTYIDSANLKAILVCYDISWKSAQGTEDFYLYLGNNDTDTIFLDVEERSTECCTFFEWIDFTINGNVIDIDTSDYIYNYKKQ